MYMKVSTDFNTTKSKVRRSTESIAIYTETESVLATKFLLHKTQTQLFACCVYNKFRELLQTFVNFSLRQNILYIYEDRRRNVRRSLGWRNDRSGWSHYTVEEFEKERILGYMLICHSAIYKTYLYINILQYYIIEIYLCQTSRWFTRIYEWAPKYLYTYCGDRLIVQEPQIFTYI